MKAPNLKAEKTGRKLRLDIYDQIGPSWLGMIDAKSVSKAITDAGDVNSIDVHINSPGGSVWEGLAIFNILKEHSAKVRVKVDGVAASSASVIAMAGDKIEMPKNALMMIHNPWTLAMGYEADLRKEADVLAKHKSAIVETYLTRVKKSGDEVSQMMDDETWFTGEEAVAAGFADKTTAEVSLAGVAGTSNEVAALFRRAPSNFSSLVALASGTPHQEPEIMADAKDTEREAAELKAKQEAEAKAAEAKAAADKLAAEAAAKAKTDLENERKRAADITAACAMAKKPELAAKFIENGAALADVNAELLKAVCAGNAPSDDGQGGPDLSKDEDAGYKAEYAKDKAAYLKEGVSEAEYVAMRRLDDGKETLRTKVA